MGQQVIRHVEYFKNAPSLFAMVLHVYDNKVEFSQYNLVAAYCQRQLSAIGLYVGNAILPIFLSCADDDPKKPCLSGTI